MTGTFRKPVRDRNSLSWPFPFARPGDDSAFGASIEALRTLGSALPANSAQTPRNHRTRPAGGSETVL